MQSGRISSSAYDIKTLKRAVSASKRLSSSTAGVDSRWCALPPDKPADRLYQAVVAQHGRFDEGGEVVHEMIAPFTGRKWALDMALPRYRIGIEMDGWEFHGKYKEGFQRDREKQNDFARYGWLLLRASNKQVRESLDNVLDALSACVSQVQRFESVEIKEIGFGRYSCITNPVQR